MGKLDVSTHYIWREVFDLSGDKVHFRQSDKLL